MNRKIMSRIWFLCIVLLMLCTGCGSKVFPLKGNYTNEYSVATQSISLDSVWSRLIDFCPHQGLSVKVIDKASGLLTFEKPGVSWTYEDDSTHKPENNSAWVVLPRKREGSFMVKPSVVTSEWSVRIQQMADGKIKVTANLVYVKYELTYSGKYSKYTKENVPDAFSSGIFEKLLFKKIG